ncbi:uncharacterized protein FMAN_07534 [Fusarium mangiferae]|uniref:Uncharacterized protein n=1 Tax=Fusarium mangiferae TaxID=192010 RepID=A0A1L7T7E1_FUSMA|nr:uncharacterized protein FMAN_07534 [Fusarium mangiferae]CVK92642.1 uncharacterized protein FMAN_07534 [Fusarium mangiferae]
MFPAGGLAVVGLWLAKPQPVIAQTLTAKQNVHRPSSFGSSKYFGSALHARKNRTHLQQDISDPASSIMTQRAIEGPLWRFHSPREALHLKRRLADATTYNAQQALALHVMISLRDVAEDGGGC